MKKFGFVLSLVIMVFASSALAKWNQPEDVPVATDRDAKFHMGYMDDDGDGKVTVDNYKKRFENMTREDRRVMRKERKKGIYKSPEERFKLMDADEDGFVTEEEMAKFYRETKGGI